MTHCDNLKDLNKLLNTIGKMHSDLSTPNDEHLDECGRLTKLFNQAQAIYSNFNYTTQCLLADLQRLTSIAVSLATCPSAKGVASSYGAVIADLARRIQNDLTKSCQDQLREMEDQNK